MFVRIVLFIIVFLSVTVVHAETVDFVLMDIHGVEHRLSDYRGKWVVVNYWATWCPPCLEEIPELVEFHDKHKDKDAVVLGVNLEIISLERLTEFVDNNFISYPVLRADITQKTLGPLPGLPTTFLVTPEGRLAARNVGPLTGAVIESYIKRVAGCNKSGSKC